MKTAHCPICKKELAEHAKNFPFCSPRCKLIDAGNWFKGSYRVDANRADAPWGEN
jgi:endogenous inhibitor of DNA gyrase (YacG/DUF329 family)